VLATFAEPVDGSAEQSPEVRLPHGIGQVCARGLAEYVVELVEHVVREGTPVVLVRQVGCDEERHQVRARRWVQDEPGQQSRLARPCLRPPPEVAVGGRLRGAERGQRGQFVRSLLKVVGCQNTYMFEVGRTDRSVPRDMDIAEYDASLKHVTIDVAGNPVGPPHPSMISPVCRYATAASG
jgi:hypothetical protein